MKIKRAVSLLASSVSVVSAGNDVWALSKRTVPATLVRHETLQARSSQQCVDDTDTLRTTVEYSAAHEEYWEEWGEYYCDIDPDPWECIADSNDLTSHNGLVRACVQAGGESYLFTYTTTCNTTLPIGGDVEAMFVGVDIPECFAPSCTEDDMEEYAADTLALLADELESGKTFAPCQAVGYDGSPNTNPTPPAESTTTPPPTVLVDASEQCVDETNALRDTPEYESASEAWADDVNNDKACSKDVSTNTETCVFDSKTYPSYNLFFSTCSQVGGETHLVSDSITCSFVDSGTNWVGNIYFVDIPECISPACDADVAETMVEAFVDMQAERIEDQLSVKYDNVRCSSPAPPLDTSAPTTSVPLFPTTGPLVFPTTGPPLVATTPKPAAATTSRFSLPPLDPSDSRAPTSSASGFHRRSSLGIITIVATFKWFSV